MHFGIPAIVNWRKAEGCGYKDFTVADGKEVRLRVNATGKAYADSNICACPGAGSGVRTNASLEVGPAETLYNRFCAYKA